MQQSILGDFANAFQAREELGAPPTGNAYHTQRTLTPGPGEEYQQGETPGPTQVDAEARLSAEHEELESHTATIPPKDEGTPEAAFIASKATDAGSSSRVQLHGPVPPDVPETHGTEAHTRNPVVELDYQYHSGSDSCSEQDSESLDATELSTECAGCRSGADVKWCNRCDTTFCDNCWGKQVAHKRAQTAHQKTDLQIRDVLKAISCQSERCQEYAHLSACSSKWFGVNCNERGVSLSASSRLRDLTIDADFRQSQYPALISFIGETGAGKSTIISALMKVCRIKTDIVLLLTG